MDVKLFISILKFTTELGKKMISLGEQCRARRELTFAKKLRVSLCSSSLMHAIGWGMATSVQVLLSWTVVFKFQCDPFSIFGGYDMVCSRLVPGDLILPHE